MGLDVVCKVIWTKTSIINSTFLYSSCLLKGYFLLMFLAGKVGEDEFLGFFRLFARKFHGQLILSQVLKVCLYTEAYNHSKLI